MKREDIELFEKALSRGTLIDNNLFLYGEYEKENKKKAIKMRTVEYIAEFLAEKEIKHIFGGHGGVVCWILWAFGNHSKLKLVPVQNEQAASMAADSYARIKDDIGVCVATSGPGFCNLISGIAGAWYDSIPMLIIVGADVTGRLRNKDQADIRQIGFQEMDVIEMTKSVTKYGVTIRDPLMIRYELEKCYHIAKEGRQGPVVLELPDDIQRSEINPEILFSFKTGDNVGNLYESAIETFLTPKIDKMKDMIKEAKRPLVIAGNGLKRARCEQEVKEFAKKTEIPVLPTWACADLFPDSPLFGISSTRAGNFAIQNADLLIVIGCRLDSHQTGNLDKFAPNAKIVMVDIDIAELNRLERINLRIWCNLDNFFKEILNGYL